MTTDPLLARLDAAAEGAAPPERLDTRVAAALRAIRVRRRLALGAIALPALLLTALTSLTLLRTPSAPPAIATGTPPHSRTTSAWTLASLTSANAHRPANDLALPALTPAPTPIPRLSDRTLTAW